jgi:thioredoxin-related protein
MMKRNLLTILIIAFSLTAWGQKVAVKWYSIQEAENLIKTSPRPMIVDTFTDWCGWCKKLDSDTFTNPVIAEILNSKFYPVKFNAEGKDPITFQGTTFVNDGKSGPSHQLAIAMLKGKMSYPNLVFFNEKIQMVTNVPGYMDAKELEPILSYFADKGYEKQSYEDFLKNFKGKL